MSELECKLYNALDELKAVCVTLIYKGDKDNDKEEILTALYNARVIISSVIKRVKEQEQDKPK